MHGCINMSLPAVKDVATNPQRHKKLKKQLTAFSKWPVSVFLNSVLYGDLWFFDVNHCCFYLHVHIFVCFLFIVYLLSFCLWF